jgi:hypothetical protein
MEPVRKTANLAIPYMLIKSHVPISNRIPPHDIPCSEANDHIQMTRATRQLIDVFTGGQELVGKKDLFDRRLECKQR